MQFLMIRDRVGTHADAATETDCSGLHGMWLNSNPDSNGIARMRIAESDGNLVLEVFAIGPEALIEWGRKSIAVFTAGPSSRIAAGFTCSYDFGFVETRLQAMILKGLIVLAELHTFKDDSNRANYFVREYFALAHGQY